MRVCQRPREEYPAVRYLSDEIMSKKVVVRVKGGIGNQLFGYAAGRRLAVANDAELVIDTVTGFTNDRVYKRKYMLNNFMISARKASWVERLEPLGRYRRWLLKKLAQRVPFERRRYLEDERMDFDPRLLSFRVRGTIFLDGSWQSENYFRDIASIIRNEYKLVTVASDKNDQLYREMQKKNAVAVHIRYFDKPGKEMGHNIEASYYQEAIQLIEKSITDPHYYLFSDCPIERQMEALFPVGRRTVVIHNREKDVPCGDFGLMKECKNFIIANSTFSWWAAWLGERDGGVVICPGKKVSGITCWGFPGLIPDRWKQVKNT